MKFRHRLYICLLALLIAALDTGAYVLVTSSYNVSLRRETESGIREHNVILSAVYTGIENADKLYPGILSQPERLVETVRPLAEYYQKQGVYCALYLKGEPLYSNAPQVPLSLLSSEGSFSTTAKAYGIRYLFAASDIPKYTGLKLVYVRDIQALDQSRAEMNRVFIWVSVLLCGALGVAAYIILRVMTRPIQELSDTTRQIAGGMYTGRVSIRRRDELGLLGETFNNMADSIQEKVALLTNAAEDRQRFIDNLSHEMKTPLTVLLGYSDYLLQAADGTEEYRQAAQQVHESAERLQTLFSKLMQLTMLQEVELECGDVSLGDLTERCAEMTAESLRQRKLTLVTHCEAGTVRGDETLLLSLLLNLLENAARASSPGQKVTLNMTPDVWEVADQGVGISAADLDKVTQPFYRADRSRSREAGGVGLGLSLCAQIAERHGAKLDISSKLGQGTNVKVIFNNSLTTR